MTFRQFCYDYGSDGAGFHREKAGEGNRTPVCSLGSCRSTIELHPRRDFRFSIAEVRFATRKNYCHEITSSAKTPVFLSPVTAGGPLPSAPSDHAITPICSGVAPALAV